MALNLVEIFELFEYKTNGPVSVNIILKLQSWGLLAKDNTLKCTNGHFLKLCPFAKASDGFVWRCREWNTANNRKKTRCEYFQSIRKNTFFDKSHLSLYQIVIFSYLWLENVSLKFIMNQVKISNSVAVDWASFHREVVFDGMIVRHDKIGGVNKTVEIDESKFGRRKYNRGHRVEGQWIFGGKERESGKCFLIPVEKRDKETLLQAIKDWILPGTTIISDCWKSYNCLEDEGFTHLTVNHSINFKDPDSGAHTNNVEGMWRHAKASLSQYSRKKHFYGGYMAKFMFLKQCKLQKVDPLITFFKLAGHLYKPEIDDDVLQYASLEYSESDSDFNDV